MCTPFEMTAKQASENLAKLVKDDLGVEIAPAHLRLFIEAKWGRLVRLAHAIHGSAGASEAGTDGKRPYRQ